MENYNLLDNLISDSKRLPVVHADFLCAKNEDIGDLFDGFDKISAITFSSNIDFIKRILRKFKQGELIFGCERILSGSIQEVFAYQSKLIERLQKKQFKEWIDSERFTFYVSHVPSHQKIYILEGPEKKRVIVGSANMSFAAFSGNQKETIICMDDPNAFDYYSSVFEELKEESSDVITATAFNYADEDIAKTPLAGTISVKQAIILEPETENETEFILDVKNLAKRIAPLMPRVENGRILVVPETIKRIASRIKVEKEKEKDLNREYPKLVVNAEGNVTLNGEILDINPQSEDIENDAKEFLRYLDGFSKFHGSTLELQKDYYAFANWMFVSPFMAVMRDYAQRFDKVEAVPTMYPVFGLIYGKSNAGKTSFLETLVKMMVGQKVSMSASEFTKSGIDALKREVCGVPIIVDDMTGQRFNQHADEAIKNDKFGYLDHLTSYPAVVFSANEDVKAVDHKITKRTVICRATAGLTTVEAMKGSIVRSVQKNVGTHFYRAYLGRMLEALPDLLSQLEDESIEDCPDILSVSSNILFDMLADYQKPYVRKLTYEDYFGAKVIGRNTITVITNAWNGNKKLFKINRKKNELSYNAGQTYEAERLIKELPETLSPRKAGSLVVMDLTEARAFFGINFGGIFLG